MWFNLKSGSCFSHFDLISVEPSLICGRLNFTKMSSSLCLHINWMVSGEWKFGTISIWWNTFSSTIDHCLGRSYQIGHVILRQLLNTFVFREESAMERSHHAVFFFKFMMSTRSIICCSNLLSCFKCRERVVRWLGNVFARGDRFHTGTHLWRFHALGWLSLARLNTNAWHIDNICVFLHQVWNGLLEFVNLRSASLFHNFKNTLFAQF